MNNNIQGTMKYNQMEKFFTNYMENTWFKNLEQ
jgi:hypothetical protein